MTGIGTRFDQFLTDIQLSSSHIDDAQTKYNGVCKKLHDHYYYYSTYNGSTKLLIGSYGKNTAIAPPTDIDLIFRMPGEQFVKYNEYTGNGQSKLLQDVRSILLERYPFTTVRGDRSVVFVDFNSYAVEIVPGFLLDNGNYYIPDSYGQGSWKQSSPEAEKGAIVSSNKKTNGNTVKLIKMLKAWKTNSSVPIKSIVLELLAIKFLDEWAYADKPSVFYDWMLRDFFKYLLGQQNGYVFMPRTFETIHCGNKWVSKAESAHGCANKACSYESDKKPLESSIEWRKIFGSRFPL